jgi:uncharacterized membrane protein YjjP (DUF1212 family)
MKNETEPIETLNHIKSIMERSSRFISLSGWSGVAAGITALAGAWFAHPYVHGTKFNGSFIKDYYENFAANNNGSTLVRFTDFVVAFFNTPLFWVAFFTFTIALVSAFAFTYFKTKKQGLAIWGTTTKRLMINMAIPLIAGGFLVLRMLELGVFGFIAPACLIFYGLALINASKYTFTEVRWLGLAQIILGIISCWNIGYGLYFWAFGFGILHIAYGIYMWLKYERA